MIHSKYSQEEICQNLKLIAAKTDFHYVHVFNSILIILCICVYHKKGNNPYT